MRAASALLALALLSCRSREEAPAGNASGAGGLFGSAAVNNQAAAAATNSANAAAAAGAKLADAEAAAEASDAGDVTPDAPPEPGTAQRAALMDALRPAVERELKGPVEFAVDRVAVQDGWALVLATPQRPGGARIDPATIFTPQELDTRDGVTVSAILRFSGGGWTVVDHKIGATDVWYCDPEVGAPQALTGC